MVFIHSVALLASILPLVQGHFSFVRLAHNGEWKDVLQYVRNKTSPFEETFTPNTNYNFRAYVNPTYVTDLPESVRCGRDNMAHAADTEVLTVKAGDTIEVAHTRYSPEGWSDEHWYNCTNGRGSCNPTYAHGYMDFNHEGPLLAHLSKVPDGKTVQEYDGTGDWVKIYSLGLDLEENGAVHWIPWNNQKIPAPFVFKIPKQTPPGEYLLRLDLIRPGLWDPPTYVSDGAQLYPSCAQIKVESESTATLPEGIKIPEGIQAPQPGMRVSLAMYRQQKFDQGYIYPGGPLWNGEELIVDKPNV